MAELKRRLEELKTDHASEVASFASKVASFEEFKVDHASKVDTLERLLQNVDLERQADNNPPPPPPPPTMGPDLHVRLL